MSDGVPQEEPDVTCGDGGYVRVRGRPLARVGLDSVKRLRMHYTTQVCEGERGWEQRVGGEGVRGEAVIRVCVSVTEAVMIFM